MDIQIGQVFNHQYPFTRDEYYRWDGDDGKLTPTWKPGVRFEDISNAYNGGDSEAVADAIGAQILTVIDIHKPGRFPVRVFYTVHWVTPDGKQFGKGRLRITTLDAFRRRARGFLHEFIVRDIGIDQDDAP
jgi:hypothetical protein